MKRIINFRIFLYIVIGLILGICCTYSFLIHNYISLCIIGIVILTYCILAILRKIITIKTITLIIGLIVGICISINAFKSFDNDIKVDTCTYIGKVDYVDASNNILKMILTDCKDITNDEKLNKNILIYSYSQNKFCNGDIVCFDGELIKTNLLDEDSINNYNYQYNIGYRISLQTEDISILDNKLSFIEKIRLKIKNTLFSSMDNTIAGISYATIVGDKSYISEEDISIFSKTGLAHILAISGLHISVFCYALKRTLQKLRVDRYINLAIVFTILIFYLNLCDFSISAVRAGIMAMCLVICDTFSARYDMLSSLSFACLIILIINPLSLFTYSFCLSVLSVLSITMLYPLLKDIAYTKIKINENFLIDGFLLSLSVQLFTIPLIINMNKEFNIISILLNIFVVPIFQVYYSILILFVVICAVIPNINFILKIPEFIFKIIFTIGNLGSLVSPIQFKAIKTFSIICYILILVTLCDYVITDKLKKFIICCVLTLIMSVSSILTNTIIFEKGKSVYIVNGITNSYILKENRDISLINVGEARNSNNLLEFLEKRKIHKINNIVFSKFDGEEVNTLINLNSLYKIEKIYILESDFNINQYMKENLSNILIIHYEANKIIQLSNFSFINHKSKNGSALEINYNNEKLLLINSGTKIEKFQYDFDLLNNNYMVIKIHSYTEKYKSISQSTSNFFYERILSATIQPNIENITQYNYIKFKNNKILKY